MVEWSSLILVGKFGRVDSIYEVLHLDLVSGLGGFTWTKLESLVWFAFGYREGNCLTQESNMAARQKGIFIKFSFRLLPDCFLDGFKISGT